MAAGIRSGSTEVLRAQCRGRQAEREGNDAAFVDRLTLTAALVEQMADGVEQVAALADPVGASPSA